MAFQTPHEALTIADTFQDRVLVPDKLVAAIELLPDWSMSSSQFGSAAQDQSGQLFEESPDLLLAFQRDLRDASETPGTTNESRAAAQTFLTALWSDVVNKLSDPATTADKIIDELFKLPEHLLLLLGEAQY